MNKNVLKTSKNYTKKGGKFDDQQKFKYILEADMVSTPEVFNNNSPTYPMKPTPVNKKSLG